MNGMYLYSLLKWLAAQIFCGIMWGLFAIETALRLYMDQYWLALLYFVITVALGWVFLHLIKERPKQ